MAETLLEDLQATIREGQVVAIVGTGVSLAATAGDPLASWGGLLEHGVDRCAAVAGASQEWANRILAQIRPGDSNDLVSAAEEITNKLGGRGGPEYARWLRETVGALRVVKRDVLEALRDLGIILATTNYDGLIEEVVGVPAVTWRAGAQVERIIRGHDKGILHLHGHWQDPESVILGTTSYDVLARDPHAQAILRAIRTMRTLMFVGFGSGLHDPSFGAFLKWAREVYPKSEYRHYRLVRAHEAAEVRSQHPPEDRVYVLPFGEKYEDLAEFLRRLRPSELETMRAETVTRASAPRLPGRPLCLGRDAEISDLMDTLLMATPVPTPVLGPPGIGKSAIALAALHDSRVAESFGSRRYFVRCEGSTSTDTLLSEIAKVVGVTPGPDFEARVLAALEAERAVLVLDNAETPWEADINATEELLARLAAETRTALVGTFRGAQRPFGTGWREAIRVGPLPEDHAREVFLAIAGERYRKDLYLDKLLIVLEGLPLAIVLIAYASEGEPDLAGIWHRWEAERVAMLRRGVGADRISNAALSFELSIASPRMTEDACRLLSMLAFLPDGIAHGDLDTLMPGSGARAASVLRKVGLAFDEADRMRVLAPIRQYVRDSHPPAAGDLGRMVSHFLHMGTAYGSRVGHKGGAEAATRLASETGNLEAVIQCGLGGDNPEPAIRAALMFSRMRQFSGADTSALLTRARDAAASLGIRTAEAACLFNLGEIRTNRSDHEQARARYEEARELYRSIGEVGGEANCVGTLGQIALQRSNYVEARSRFEEALPLSRRAGDRLGEANWIFGLGEIAARQSEYDEARSRHEEALPIYREIGDLVGEANCIGALGETALKQSRLEEARSRYEAALPLFRSIGWVVGEANCIFGIGEVASRRLDYSDARRRYEEALPLYRRVCDILGEGNCLKSFGELALVGGDCEEARRCYEAALPLYRRVGDVLGEAHCIFGLGEVASKLGNQDEARGHYEVALPIYRQIRNVRGEATCLRVLGDIARARAALDVARAYYEKGLLIVRDVGRTLAAANCFFGLGETDRAQSRPKEARTHFEEARARFRDMGNVLGEANCLARLGDIAASESEGEAARQHFGAALDLFAQAGETFSVGAMHFRLALVEQDVVERSRHVDAGIDGYQRSGHGDLVEEALKRFGGGISRNDKEANHGDAEDRK